MESREKTINYLRIALALQKITASNEICDRIIETYEKVLELKGSFSLQDAVAIELKMDEKYKTKELTAQ